MTLAMEEYIGTARQLAEGRGLTWPPTSDKRGVWTGDDAWDLLRLAGMPRGPSNRIGFDLIARDRAAIEECARERNPNATISASMPDCWRNFLLAVVIHQVLVARHRPDAAYRAARSVKFLAMAGGGCPPEHVGPAEVGLAYNACLRVNPSAAKHFVALIKSTFDALHLSAFPNLFASLTPYPDGRSREAAGRFQQLKERGRHSATGPSSVGRGLGDRKEAGRLPDSRAFWELCRIVFCEEPRSVLDLQLFAAAKLHIITGLRAEEIAMVPLDCERWRDWTDLDGRPAGERGGISRSLSLRYFAKKQEGLSDGEVSLLRPLLQAIPQRFEDIVHDTIAEVVRVTRPMRDTLRAQVESGRLFPDLRPDALVPVDEAYVRLTGNLALRKRWPIPEALLDALMRGGGGKPPFDPTHYDAIFRHQVHDWWAATRARKDKTTGLGTLAAMYIRYAVKRGLLVLRTASGVPDRATAEIPGDGSSSPPTWRSSRRWAREGVWLHSRHTAARMGRRSSRTISFS